jgi:aminopeptidase N
LVLLQIERPVDKIVLNSKELAITGVQLITDKLKDEILTPEINLIAEDETLTLQFLKEVPAGKAELTIEFNGELNDKMVGFYRSKCIK